MERPSRRDVIYVVLALLCLLVGLAGWIPAFPELVRVVLGVTAVVGAGAVMTAMWLVPALVRRWRR